MNYQTLMNSFEVMRNTLNKLFKGIDILVGEVALPFPFIDFLDTVDNTLVYQSRDHKIDPPLLWSFG